MQVVVNEKLVRDRVRLASAFHLSALAVFGVGLWVSWVQPDQILASYVAIVIGLLLYNFGQFFLRRWGPRARQDATLTKALKGLDNRYTLLAFSSSKLPDYMLVGPGSVQVIVPRNHDGTIICRADRWSRESRAGLGRVLSWFGGTPLGNPGLDVSRAVQRVRERLRRHGLEGGSEPPVAGLVLFTNPTARLRIDGCSQPVMGLKQVRNYLRGSKGSLSPQALANIVRALRQ